MRIIIDLQGGQSESRFRGIGRYSMSLAKEIAKNAKDHEVWIMLNDALGDSILSIRDIFKDIVPEERILVFQVPYPIAQAVHKQRTAELIREYFIQQLEPDILLISSLIEGYVDDAVLSIGHLHSNHKTVAILYDLIPLMDPQRYLRVKPFQDFYMRKIEELKKADLTLSISEASRREAIDALNIPEDHIFTISSAVDDSFRPISYSQSEQKSLFKKYQITRKMLMYAPGGFDIRKNFDTLIDAYTLLPDHLKTSYQLVIVSKLYPDDKRYLQMLLKKSDLKKDDCILTGYVPDEDLIALYNLATLFIFPSKHEGFGLPALEAMACGAPVIGSNTTSIPEVIGFDEALFDPNLAQSIAGKIEQVLTDSTFKKKVIEKEQKHIQDFSWELSAQKALKHMTTLSINHPTHKPDFIENEKSYRNFIHEIATATKEEDLVITANCIVSNNYMIPKRQLFVDISELIHRDAATGVQRVVRSYLKELLDNPPAGFTIEPVFATLEVDYHYAHRYMAKYYHIEDETVIDRQIEVQRGDIFFVLDLQHHIQLTHKDFLLSLKSRGVNLFFMVYDLLPIQLENLFDSSEHKKLHEDLLKMIALSNGAVCISQTTANAYQDWIELYGIKRSPEFTIEWIHIGGDIDASLPSKGLPKVVDAILEKLKQKPTFITVGTLEPRKAQQQVFEAFKLLWKEGLDVNLVIVGKPGWKVEELMAEIENHPERGARLFHFNGISDEYLEKLYKYSTCLIAASINEGFGLPLIEAAHHHIPIIARDIPIFREVAGNHAFYFSSEEPERLKNTILDWLALFEKQKQPSSKEMPWSSWRESSQNLTHKLTKTMYRKKQLLVDISELVQTDAKTGIQRVVKKVLLELTARPPRGYFVEPIYAVPGQIGYRYARNFMLSFSPKAPDALIPDTPIDIGMGDIYLGLDMSPGIQTLHSEYYKKLRQVGAKVFFVVYDLLPVLYPEWWSSNINGQQEAVNNFSNWLETVSVGNGAVCISQHTADDLKSWLTKNIPEKISGFNVLVSHIGADIKTIEKYDEMAEEDIAILQKLVKKTTFLMVGTLEPRKGYLQTIEAFERLWKDGHDINLVIVGKQGWLVEKLVEKLQNHPKKGENLFWLQGVNDSFLEKLYKVSSCLIAASMGEGFGLPLIEAAQHQLPIIARDLLVFHEVAGEYAYYFENNNDPEVLADAVTKWLDLYEKNLYPKSDSMSWLTWKESTQVFLRQININYN